MRTGSVGLVNGTQTQWSVHWVSDDSLNLEQAKQLASSIYDAFWKEVSTNPAFEAELQLRAQELPKIGKKIIPEMIGFKINFWDKNVNRYKPPYIAQIKLSDGILSYYFADPLTQELSQPIVQPINH